MPLMDEAFGGAPVLVTGGYGFIGSNLVRRLVRPAYRDIGAGTGRFPAAEQAASEILSLPIFPELDDSGIGTVCDAIRAFAA